MKLIRTVFAVVVVAVLSGCTPGGTPPPNPDTSPIRTASPEPSVEAEPEPVEEEPWIAFGGIYGCLPISGPSDGTTNFRIFYADGLAMSATSTAGVAQIDIVAQWFHRDSDKPALSMGEFVIDGDTLQGSTTTSANPSSPVTVTFSGLKGDDGSIILDTTSQFNGYQETVVCHLARA